WDLKTQQEKAALAGHSGSVNWVAFSPDGKTLATGSDDGTVRLWDTTTGQETQVLCSPGGPVHFVQFSPDGETLAANVWASVVSDAMVILWDVATGEMRAALKGHTLAVFSPDGKTLAAGLYDSSVVLYDVHTGQERVTLEGEPGLGFNAA